MEPTELCIYTRSSHAICPQQDVPESHCESFSIKPPFPSAMSWLQVTLQHTSPYSVHHMDCGLVTGSGCCLLGSALSTCGDSYTSSVGCCGDMFMCVTTQHSAWSGSHARIFFFCFPKCWRYENKVKSMCPNNFLVSGKTEVKSDGDYIPKCVQSTRDCRTHLN